MPTRPKRPCRHPGCREFAEDGEQFCEEHRKQAEHQYNRYQRDPGTKKMYGRAWKRIRDRHIHEHPLCEECLKQGIIKTAEEVHHKLPLADGVITDVRTLSPSAVPAIKRLMQSLGRGNLTQTDTPVGRV